ncbi:ABC transporter ATP-binding protein [Alicyclobacillus ferrooxydans]|uniref:ABC transporter domain-containing protein n=1 Tax=Alicyclobacillus ferrooxydans TaxID=471514 RepID=A0A0P9CZG3_9BACL|nr:ABC transporter ATP-binding protein [Alicyclobacillus ferrooxydans]KPV45107.1 hypothetical protein AN477_03730 [Alicyclobacillus ferrooxydans]
MSEILSIQSLSSGYEGMQVLNRVSLSVDQGVTAVLLGANGAGKTTLLKSTLGIISPMSGEVFIDGNNVTKDKPEAKIRKGIAYFSEFGVLPNLSIHENLKLGGFFLHHSDLKDKVAYMYEKFPDLKEKRKELAGSLSGGQRKMLGMARALISQPKLVLMDEPSAGLSPLFVNQVISLVKEFKKEFGSAFLIAEQNVKFLDIADHVFVLDGGEITFTGTVAELQESDAISKAYFGVH